MPGKANRVTSRYKGAYSPAMLPNKEVNTNRKAENQNEIFSKILPTPGKNSTNTFKKSPSSHPKTIAFARPSAADIARFADDVTGFVVKGE